jgi:signal transduction histidine kinase
VGKKPSKSAVGEEKYTYSRTTRYSMDRSSSESAGPRDEALLGAALDGTDQLAYVFDADGELRWWNEAVRERTERTDAELAQLSGTEAFLAVVTPADRRRAANAFDRLKHSGEMVVELDVLMDEGTAPYELRGSATTVSGDTLYFVIGYEISDRLEHERKVEQLRRCTLQLMGTTTRAESADIAATASNEVIGAPLSGVFFVDESGETLVLAAAAHEVADAFETDPRYERDAPDGSRSKVVWDAYESGEPLILDDVRASMELSEESPARNVIIYPLGDHGVLIVSSPTPDAFDDTDEALVDILATSLRASLDRVDREERLRRQNDRLDEFASILSHDLRNPLNIAEGHLGLAREAADPEPNFDAVERSLDRIGTLVDDLLTLAREGKTSVDKQRVEVGDLARSCWLGVPTEGADLRVSLEGSVDANESRLRQLFENLFRNSVEHGADGSGLVVTVGRLSDGNGFYVADDGVGIPESQRDKVLAVGYSTVADGTGLGLSIVEEAATAHGWSIEITESETGGARFEFHGVEWV